VRHWRLAEIETPHGTRSPVVLHSTDDVRRIVSGGGARVLLLLAPWPGEGHYWGDRQASSGVSAS
jgi:hypothetical protein